MKNKMNIFAQCLLNYTSAILTLDQTQINTDTDTFFLLSRFKLFLESTLHVM
jgi:hypothetical protein